jgi:hypothetical protein
MSVSVLLIVQTGALRGNVQDVPWWAQLLYSPVKVVTLDRLCHLFMCWEVCQLMISLTNVPLTTIFVPPKNQPLVQLRKDSNTKGGPPLHHHRLETQFKRRSHNERKVTSCMEELRKLNSRGESWGYTSRNNSGRQKVVVVQPLHLVQKTRHCLLPEDLSNGSVTTVSLVEEMALPNSWHYNDST